MPFIMTVAIILSLRTLGLNKKTFRIYISIATIAFIISFVIGFISLEIVERLLWIVTLSFFSVFLSLSIILLIKKMFLSNEITFDTIVGGICVYLLLGYLWSIFYMVIFLFDQAAFVSNLNEPINFFYFSFTTFTTLGYGDIYPVNKFAKVLTSLEAITGQLYLAVFIARIVGMYRSKRVNK